ncbi:MAG: DUF2284 domain-containing protein [Firmicutes bacterium]|nr:DUF2284 domain-containing protein [Bacillota bacterium]
MGLTEKMTEYLLDAGMANAKMLPCAEVPFDLEFRKMCEMNSCGCYGKNWMCPPAVGPAEELIAKARSYRYALVYQSISPLKDSYDFEGMDEAMRMHSSVSRGLEDLLAREGVSDYLNLSAGECTLCEKCAKIDDEPCRHPDKAIPSLEAYCVYVSELAGKCGMRYINGADTVTYFGVLFYNCQER